MEDIARLQKFKKNSLDGSSFFCCGDRFPCSCYWGVEVLREAKAWRMIGRNCKCDSHKCHHLENSFECVLRKPYIQFGIEFTASLFLFNEVDYSRNLHDVIGQLNKSCVFMIHLVCYSTSCLLQLKRLIVQFCSTDKPNMLPHLITDFGIFQTST